MNSKCIISAILASLVFVSCFSGDKLVTTSVAYQSVRPTSYKSEVPDDAKIVVGYSFSKDGELSAYVKNMTDEVMIIDQTKSFLVNSDGQSMSYYDPTLRVSSNTNSTSKTNGGSVNLGAVAGLFGIGGPLGTLANGINVGGSSTDGFSETNTTYLSDQPQISIAPKGSGLMSKNFSVKNIGEAFLNQSNEINKNYSELDSYCKFSVCISYSIDGGNTFNKIVTDMYSNSCLVSPVKTHGQVNDALRTLFGWKPDALKEQCWILHFNSNVDGNNSMLNGMIVDYK